MQRIGDTCDVRHRVQRAYLVIVNFSHRASVSFRFRLCDGIIYRTGMPLHFHGQIQSVDQLRNLRRR